MFSPQVGKSIRLNSPWINEYSENILLTKLWNQLTSKVGNNMNEYFGHSEQQQLQYIKVNLKLCWFFQKYYSTFSLLLKLFWDKSVSLDSKQFSTSSSLDSSWLLFVSENPFLKFIVDTVLIIDLVMLVVRLPFSLFKFLKLFSPT